MYIKYKVDVVNDFKYMYFKYFTTLVETVCTCSFAYIKNVWYKHRSICMISLIYCK